MSRRVNWLGIVCLLGALACTASTKLTDVWRSPKFSGPPLKTLMVFAQSHDPGHRRLIEDAYVAQLREAGVAAIPSYSVLPQDHPEDAAVHDAIARSGADGLVLVQVTSITQEISAAPAPYPYYAVDPFFFPAYGAGFGLALGPAWTADTVVRLSTSVYRADGGNDLVFAATSRTFDPKSAGSLARDVARHVVDACRQLEVF